MAGYTHLALLGAHSWAGWMSECSAICYVFVDFTIACWLYVLRLCVWFFVGLSFICFPYRYSSACVQSWGKPCKSNWNRKKAVTHVKKMKLWMKKGKVKAFTLMLVLWASFLCQRKHRSLSAWGMHTHPCMYIICTCKSILKQHSLHFGTFYPAACSESWRNLWLVPCN